jgi:hypothetical protein
MSRSAQSSRWVLAGVIASVVSNDTGGALVWMCWLAKSEMKELAGVIARAIGTPRQLRVAKTRPISYVASCRVPIPPVVSPRHKEPETQNVCHLYEKS